MGRLGTRGTGVTSQDSTDTKAVPAKVYDALLDFFEQHDEPDDYWNLDKWDVVSWSGQLHTLFLRHIDPTWRRIDHAQHEREIDEYMRPRVGRKYQTGYFTPRRNKRVAAA